MRRTIAGVQKSTSQKEKSSMHAVESKFGQLDPERTRLAGGDGGPPGPHVLSSRKSVWDPWSRFHEIAPLSVLEFAVLKGGRGKSTFPVKRVYK